VVVGLGSFYPKKTNRPYIEINNHTMELINHICFILLSGIFIDKAELIRVGDIAIKYMGCIE
jgi:hypothetical protein